MIASLKNSWRALGVKPLKITSTGAELGVPWPRYSYKALETRTTEHVPKNYFH